MQRLLEKESGVRGLRVELLRVHAPMASREVVVGMASRDAKQLWGLLRPKVEGMNLGYGVEGVVLTAYWVQRIVHRQTGVWGMGEYGDRADEQFEAFLDTVINRWGTRRVLAARPTASHTPEVARGFRDVHEEKGEAELLFMDRPTVMLEEPEATGAVALQPDHPPSRLQWRGQEHLLSAGVGPERIATAWWGKQVSSTRDYFKVQTAAGTWLWVFRELESGEWFVHGLWT
jgi:protein ImuB